MRGRFTFLALVAFFTLFGAGRSHDWSVVATDQAGWTYLVDLYSVRVEEPQVLECRVLAAHAGGAEMRDRWRLDAVRRTLLRRSEGRPEPILSGSIADRAILFFRERGVLPPLPPLGGPR